MARKSRKTVITPDTNIFQPICKAAAYVRLSIEKEQTLARGTIENQANFIKEYIARQENMELYDIYVDDDITGTTYDRPDFQRMMKDIRCKIDDELEQDRLRKIERENEERERYKMALPDGVHIPSRNVGIRDYLIDTDTPAYHKLEQLARDLFVKFGSNANHTDLFHCVDDKVRSDWNEKYYNQRNRSLTSTLTAGSI